MSTRELQKRVCANRVYGNFVTKDISEEFCLLYGEISDAYEAWWNGKRAFSWELADIAIYLLGIAEKNGIDLGREVELKIAIDESSRKS